MGDGTPNQPADLPARPEDMPAPRARMTPRGTYAELRVEVPGIESAVRAQVQTPEDWVTAEDWRTSWAPPFDVRAASPRV